MYSNFHSCHWYYYLNLKTEVDELCGCKEILCYCNTLMCAVFEMGKILFRFCLDYVTVLIFIEREVFSVLLQFRKVVQSIITSFISSQFFNHSLQTLWHNAMLKLSALHMQIVSIPPFHRIIKFIVHSFIHFPQIQPRTKFTRLWK
jgi:hypothetical protein